MATHPELEAEQAHVDRAYKRLDQLRTDTEELIRSVIDQGRGGTHQFREERDVIVRTSLARLDQLDIGEQALCFGRIDRRDGTGSAAAGETESFHIGRLGISGEDLEPLVVDWRAPVAEPFYRATGRDPMGLVLRRHLAAQGRRIVGVEDERFGISPQANGSASRADGAGTATIDGGPGWDDAASGDGELELGGPGALLAALEGARTGVMRDIVATIQREQDEIIRSALPGVMVVQGGPGTGKTAVALHRAAYLLYTHRFPLERQGVLVIGPNPLFLRYIEHVLPSLGESGVTLSTIEGLVHAVQVRAEDPPGVARLKGEARLSVLVGRAVRSRERPLRRDAEVPFGATVLRLSAEASAVIVSATRRRPGSHNARRRFLEQLVVRRLADEYLRTLRIYGVGPSSPEGDDRAASDPAAGSVPGIADLAGHQGNGHRAGPAPGPGSARADDGFGLRPGPGVAGGQQGPNGEPGDEESGFDLGEFSRQVRRIPEVIDALDRMWPRLSAEEMLHDLFGSPPLLALAAKGVLSPAEQQLLLRPRSGALNEIPWTVADLALIDEARVLLGPRRPRPGGGRGPRREPPYLRPHRRRRGPGPLTHAVALGVAPVAVGVHHHGGRHRPGHRPVGPGQLGRGHRPSARPAPTPSGGAHGELPHARRSRRGRGAPAGRDGAGVAPAHAGAADRGGAVFRAGGPGAARRAGGGAVHPDLCRCGARYRRRAGAGVAGGGPGRGPGRCRRARHLPRRDGLGSPLSLLPVDLANGLEFDAVVVVEPAAIVEESPQGLRALYVALTRPTRRLTVIHTRPLPATLRG